VLVNTVPFSLSVCLLPLQPSQSSIDLEVDIGVDSTEVGQDDESEDDNSAGFYYDKQPPEIPLPRQHRSNSLRKS
jgi:hypothetical protein